MCVCVLKARQDYLDNMGGSPGKGSVYLQGVSLDRFLLCHLFLVNYVEREIIKEATIIVHNNTEYMLCASQMYKQQQKRVTGEKQVRNANSV